MRGESDFYILIDPGTIIIITAIVVIMIAAIAIAVSTTPN